MVRNQIQRGPEQISAGIGDAAQVAAPPEPHEGFLAKVVRGLSATQSAEQEAQEFLAAVPEKLN
jgi:hypothetical protein